MKRIRVIVVVALILSANIASAGVMSGNGLLCSINSEKLDNIMTEDADSTVDFGEYVLGLGYILGVFDSYQGLYYCAPRGITRGQVRDVALKYLQTHPEMLHKRASILLLEAFTEAFPMKQ